MKGVCATRATRFTVIPARPIRLIGLLNAILLAIIGEATFAGAKTTPPSPPKTSASQTPSTLVTRDADLLSLPTPTPIRGMSWPALSPDGKTLCFTYLGDLWAAPAEGGTAMRLTVNESLSAAPHWSPDGKF